MDTPIRWIVDSYLKLQDVESLHRLKFHRLELLRAASDRSHRKDEFISDCERDLSVIDAALQRLCKDWAVDGHVEVFSDARIAGWACYPGHDDVPLLLRIVFDNSEVGHVMADRFRPDLERAGYGNGYHGFEFIPSTDTYSSSGKIEVCAPNHVILGSLKK